MENVMQEMLQRIDAVAKKLGIAAEHIWGFTVRAKAVQARRDLATAIFLALVGFALLAWPIHVSRMKLAHEMRTEMHEKCGTVQGTNFRSCWDEASASVETDKFTDHSLALVASALIVLLFGLSMAVCWLVDVIAAIARMRTVEYDAYQDLLGDFLP